VGDRGHREAAIRAMLATQSLFRQALQEYADCVTTRTIEVLPDADAVFRRAAMFIADRVRSCVDERNAFSLALSGGRVQPMLELLDKEDLPWEAVDIFQVDERVAPRGHPERNLTQIDAALTHARVHPMPVEDEDLWAAAARYEAELPERLDLVHLGLGPDGHTASLVPDCGALEVEDRDVAISREYNGRRRMTLTYPAIDRAREVIWVVNGEDKAEPLAQVLAKDDEIPAGRVRSPVQYVFTDQVVTYS
jgi:6-phosphogluconolactonase